MEIVFIDTFGADVRDCGPAVDGRLGAIVRVTRNDGAASFTGTSSCMKPWAKADGSNTGFYASSVRLADVNGDGFVDMIHGAHSSWTQDNVMLNNGDGTFNFNVRFEF